MGACNHADIVMSNSFPKNTPFSQMGISPPPDHGIIAIWTQGTMPSPVELISLNNSFRSFLLGQWLVHSLKLTTCPGESDESQKEISSFSLIDFQGQTCSFREGNVWIGSRNLPIGSTGIFPQRSTYRGLGPITYPK